MLTAPSKLSSPDVSRRTSLVSEREEDSMSEVSETLLSEEEADKVDQALQKIEDVSSGNMGSLCVTESYLTLPTSINPFRYDSARQKADLMVMILQDLGLAHHNGLVDVIGRGILASEKLVLTTRILALNSSTGQILNAVVWQRHSSDLLEPHRVTEDNLQVGLRPDSTIPWFEDAHSSPGLRSPKFISSPQFESYKGWWTYPYYACQVKKWVLSYSVIIPPSLKHETRGFLSLDVDISSLQVNQCDTLAENNQYAASAFSSQISVFHGTHKCHNSTQCIFRQASSPTGSWIRGGYVCKCRQGYYSATNHDFNGSLVEAAWLEKIQNLSTVYDDVLKCRRCAPGCITCRGPAPCLASYNWPFRITLLSISVSCILFTLGLVVYVYQHRRIKVFKVASPIFLGITLIGCAIMYSEMAAIFPVLDLYSCIVTKWCRHLGFCITYTALLMKTWRVSLTYRVKSAHKVKLTDKQLLQWMFPILLVMLIYLSTWTISAPPYAEQIKDSSGLLFRQCSFNWWDHSLAIGEVLFLAWGIRVCYNVRNAESLYNEARLITFAIYNIAVVNIAMVAFHVFLFPHAGPDIKYLLGFIRTQLSTSVTVGLVFGPKVIRVIRGQGDQWDNRARARGVTASFSLNGIGLVPEEAPDLYQENEELKEEIQKLAGQIEFMKIVQMEINNRHLKPKQGGYFSPANTSIVLQSPITKPSGGSFIMGKNFNSTTGSDSTDERV
ncbi:putative G-protein coupled receptor CG31760 [Lycorma delicatula]|uniref:putative G-protein coupled receptor CG31760 n=1 Tax=Lycorma delicatula TaxID=130591 RepID=UPI003F518285